MTNLDFIYKRKSVRKFKDQEVPREDLLKLLEAATYAPSPKHQQNWHFVVIQNQEKIKHIAELVTKSHESYAALIEDEEERKKFMALCKYYVLFKDAPVVILVYARPYYMVEAEILKNSGAPIEAIEALRASDSNAQGIGAAVENLLLGAANIGYGTCYMTGPLHARTEIETLINFEKEGYDLLSLVALGVPADETAPQPSRKPLDKVVTFI